MTDDLPRLFTESDIYAVVNAWNLASGEPGSLCARSMYAYTSRIAVTLERNGCEAQAATVATAIMTIPVIQARPHGPVHDEATGNMFEFFGDAPAEPA